MRVARQAAQRQHKEQNRGQSCARAGESRLSHREAAGTARGFSAAEGPEGFQRQDMSPSALPPLLLYPPLSASPTPLNILSLCSLGAWSCRASPALCFAMRAGTHGTPGCNLTTGWATASSLPSQSSLLGPLSLHCAKPLFPPIHLLASSPSPLSPPHRILAAPLLSASPLLQPPQPHQTAWGEPVLTQTSRP